MEANESIYLCNSCYYVHHAKLLLFVYLLNQATEDFFFDFDSKHSCMWYLQIGCMSKNHEII